jgi:SAM-dependent methyltransferase
MPSMGKPEPTWRESLGSGLVEAEWALLASGASPGRTLRIAPDALPVVPQALGLHVAGAARLGGPLICGEAALPFDDGEWSRVVLHHVLEHPEVDRALLGEAVRVLAPSGELVVFGFDPMAPGVLLRWMRDGRWRRELSPVPPYRLAHALGMCGLARVTVTGLGPRWRAVPRTGELGRSGGIGRCLYLLRARKLESRVIPLRRAFDRVEVRSTGLAPTAGRRALEVA